MFHFSKKTEQRFWDKLSQEECEASGEIANGRSQRGGLTRIESRRAKKR